MIHNNETADGHNSNHSNKGGTRNKHSKNTMNMSSTNLIHCFFWGWLNRAKIYLCVKRQTLMNIIIVLFDEYTKYLLIIYMIFADKWESLKYCHYLYEMSINLNHVIIDLCSFYHFCFLSHS